MRQNLAVRQDARAPQPAEKPIKPKRRKGRARAVLDRPPAAEGWRTTDAEEIELRRWRGSTEITAIEALEGEHPVFGTFRTRSGTGGSYEVEIRSLEASGNSCGCIDYRVNGLGTCKHVEGVLAALRRRGVKTFRAAASVGSARVEVFLDRRDVPHPALAWPAPGNPDAAAIETDRMPGKPGRPVAHIVKATNRHRRGETVIGRAWARSGQAHARGGLQKSDHHADGPGQRVGYGARPRRRRE